MKINKLIAFVFLIFVFSSCANKIEKAEIVGNEFYTFIKNNQIDQIYTLLDPQTIPYSEFPQWENAIRQQLQDRGDLQNFKVDKVNFFRTKNNDFVVKLRYRVTYLYGIFLETLTIIRRQGSKKYYIVAYKNSEF